MLFCKFTLFCSFLTLCATAGAAEVPTFNKDVRPILADNCFSCHGKDAKHRKADLRLDMPDGAEGATVLNKDGVTAIVPGNAAQSEAWKRILSADPEEVMPPPDTHKVLTATQRDVLKRWIDAGAKYEQHWAFEAPTKPTKEGTGATAIDFLWQQENARLGLNGLHQAPEADKPTLIRRVAFALTGLPPNLAEVDAFLADAAEGAYERMVDRFLAKPSYGEEMARHWLDLARYGDTHGLHLDNERHMWTYRDWVVEAFNKNLAYDQFTIEQLAGDLLPEPTDSQLIATGFNRCNVTTSEGGAIADEWTFRYAVDRASTMAQAWLGLTAGCAVCHDHKYDPISQKEFYQLYAFFYSNSDPAMDGNATNTAPVLRVMGDEEKAQFAALKERRASVDKQLDEVVAGLAYSDPATQQPPPPEVHTQVDWFADSFPHGAAVEGQVTLVGTAENEPVHSGERSLKQSGDGIVQVHYASGAEPLVVPKNGVFSMQVFLPKDKPARQVMVQFNTGDWSHRASWGQNVIPWGEAGKPSRMLMGDLPELGKWIELSVPFAKLGLKDGAQIKGFALTLETGTAYFDTVKATGAVSPAKDAAFSYSVWLKQQIDAKGKELREPFRALAKKLGKNKPTDDETKDLLRFYLGEIWQSSEVALQKPRAALQQILKEEAAIETQTPVTFIYRELPKPRQAHIMARGQYDQPLEAVQPAVPAIFPAIEAPAPNRLDLAKWLVSPKNPLTARVAVNRLWQQFFGLGLVKSSHDFGVMGDLPSNGPLLDYLAIHFQSIGWDTKRLIKAMVCSKPFRQASETTPSLQERDPENVYLLRGPRFRLDGEQLRDNALATSGLLVPTFGGRGVNPYQPKNIWEPVGYGDSNTRFYKQDKGAKLYRRSLYTFFKRTAPHPMFTNFDSPNREQPCSRRERSNTPLQALQLMNDTQHFEAARMLAEQTMKRGGQSAELRLNFLYRTVLARPPQAEETSVMTQFLESQLAKYSAAPEEATKVTKTGEFASDATLPAAELAAWTLACNLVLNLDETVNRN